MSIEGKVALVTGAGQGIGRAIALRLARDGADLCLVDIRRDTIEAVAKEIVALGRKATVFLADVGEREQVHASVDHAEKELGGFDIMVNNAGIALVQPIAAATPEEVSRVLKINIEGTLWGIQAAGKKIIERGQKGKIINASSIAGHEGSQLFGVYAATKFAVRALTQSAAKEYAAYGITVNSYCPGIVGTDMWDKIDDRFVQITGSKKGETTHGIVSGIALGRMETPEDVAGLVSFFAGPDSDYMTGQSVMIDGGIIMN